MAGDTWMASAGPQACIESYLQSEFASRSSTINLTAVTCSVARRWPMSFITGFWSVEFIGR
jgi:hypothetical protein